MRKTLKRITSLALVLSMVLSMVITCAFADGEDSGSVSSNSTTVSVSTAEALQTAVQNTKDYTSYDEVIVQLTANIDMTGYLVTSIGPTAVTIDGQGQYTLSATGSTVAGTTMFKFSTFDGNTLTFRNITIGAGNQQFFATGANTAVNSWLVLDNVTMTGLNSGTASAGNTTEAGIYFGAATTSGTESGVRISKSTISGTGCFIDLLRAKLTVENSSLTFTSAYSTQYLINLPTSSASCPAEATISGTTITMNDADYPMYAVNNAGAYSSVTVDGGSTITGTGNTSSCALYVNSASATATLNACTLSNTDGSAAQIKLNNAGSLLYTNGQVQGSPEVVLTSTESAQIRLTGSMAYPLEFSFSSSISGLDPEVAAGSSGYTLLTSDLNYLTYASETARTLSLDAESNTAVFYRASEIKAIYVSTAQELQNALASTAYDDYPQLTIYLSQDITMDSDTVITTVIHTNVVIDGQGQYTLTGPAGDDLSTCMFGFSKSANALPSNGTLVFQNITIDANRQQFLCLTYGSGASLSLSNVTLKNLYSTAATTAKCGFYVKGGSSNLISVTLNNVKTEDCEGLLMYLGVTSVSIQNSDLSTTFQSGTTYTAAYALYILGQSSTYPMTAAISGSSVSWTGEPTYGINVGTSCNLTLDGGSQVTGATNTTPAIYCSSTSASYGLILNACTISNADGSRAQIKLNSYSNVLTTNGQVQGEPEVYLTYNNATSYSKIALTGSLAYPLYFTYSKSIGSTETTVATGSGDYKLTADDAANLICDGSPRTVTLDTDSNSAIFSRTALTEDMVELVDAATEMVYCDEDGNEYELAEENGVYTTTDLYGETVTLTQSSSLSGTTYTGTDSQGNTITLTPTEREMTGTVYCYTDTDGDPVVLLDGDEVAIYYEADGQTPSYPATTYTTEDGTEYIGQVSTDESGAYYYTAETTITLTASDDDYAYSDTDGASFTLTAAGDGVYTYTDGDGTVTLTITDEGATYTGSDGTAVTLTATSDGYTGTCSTTVSLMRKDTAVYTTSDGTAVLCDDNGDPICEEITVPVYYAEWTETGSVKTEPTVTVTVGGAEVDSSYYAVSWADSELTDADADLQAGYTWVGTAIVTPDSSDLTGDAVSKYYIAIVPDYLDLAAYGSAAVTYSDGDGYVTTVYYTDPDTGVKEELTEAVDYVLTYSVNTDTYVTTVTVSGIHAYGGSFSKEISIYGQKSAVRYVTSEEELNDALDDLVGRIYIDGDFSVENEIVIGYDVTIDGQGHTISAGSGVLVGYTTDDSGTYYNALVHVEDGASVSLDDLTLDGGGVARLLYAGEGSSVSIGSGAVLTNGSNSANSSCGSGTALYVDTSAEVVLEGTVSNVSNIGTNIPIYILGTLTVQGNAYLTGLASYHSAIRNYGTLNWAGGTFDVNGGDKYFSNCTISSGGTVIDNRGEFNLSGGAITGFSVTSGGYSTTRTTAYFGGIYNAEGAEFTMTGGTISGFYATGTYNEMGGTYAPTAGGGVCNYGTFTMSGGTITGNYSAGYGGGVYNQGVFYLSDKAVISNNTAAYGGGVYNSGDRTIQKDTDAISAGSFYMTGGAITGNALTSASISVSTSSDRQSSGSTISGGGSALYADGNSVTVISGGTISGNTATATASITDADGATTSTAVGIGIVVAPSTVTTSGATGSAFTATTAADAHLTITGSPEIDAAILLIHSASTSYTAYLNSYTDAEDISTYVYTDTSDATETSLSAWLTLDGGLATKLTVNTLGFETEAHKFSNVNMSSDAYSSITTSALTLNRDGDLLAVYADRVSASEDDGDLFALSTDANLVLASDYTLTTATTSSTMDETTTTTTETTFDCAWIICSHSSTEKCDAVASTCTEAGHIEYYVCSTCGTTVDADGNTLSEEDIALPLADHTLTYVSKRDATCTEVGYTENFYLCSVCGAAFQYVGFTLTEIDLEDITAPATGVHTWNNGEVTTEATCTEAGEMTYTCSGCGATKTETIPATGHTWGSAVRENEVAATETASGSYDLVYYCTDCDAELARTSVIVSATGHTYGAPTFTWADDYSSATAAFTCSVCNDVLTAVCAVTSATTEATVTEDGKTVYTASVTLNGTKYTDTKTVTIPATGATFLFDDVRNTSVSYYDAVYWAYGLGITTGTSATLFSPGATCTRAQFVTFLYRLAQATGADTSVTITNCDFTDVSSGASYYQAMLWAVENGITNGTSATTFSPSKTITRAQAVTMLYRYEMNVVNGGVAPAVGTTSTGFTDVVAGSSYETAVLWAVENGITSGTSATTFSPSNPCTRGQMVTFLYRYAG